MTVPPGCDACGRHGGVQRVEVRTDSEPRPVLSARLCGPCREPLLTVVAEVQNQILSAIR